MQLITNIIRVALSNIVNFGSSFIVGFILPVFLSVTEYGMYREFTLYISFVYLFNLGFNDGIYIKYGGKDKDSIDKNEVKNEHLFLLIFQFIIFICLLIYSIVINNVILIFFSFSSFFTLVSKYHQNFMQAIGEFKIYSFLNITRTFVNILTILFGILILKSKSSNVYIGMYMVTTLIMFLVYELYYYKAYGTTKITKIYNFKKHILLFKVGFLVLVANMAMTFVGNMASWIVKFKFTVQDFAQYSFSTSILNVILLVVSAVSIIFYNIISKNENKKMLKITKILLLIIGIIGGELFFLIQLIMNTFLQKYIPALSFLSITFISIPYIMVTNVIITNLYKSRKDEKKYFKDMIFLSIFTFLTVSASYLLTKSMIIMAITTTFVYILWYFYSTTIKFNYLKSTKKEMILLISHFVIFYFSANYFSNLFGAIIYMVYSIIVLLNFKEEFKEIIKYARK